MRLEKEAGELTRSGLTESDRLMDVYDRLEQLDSATSETKAARILHGLGWHLHACLFHTVYSETCVASQMKFGFSEDIECHLP